MIKESSIHKNCYNTRNYEVYCFCQISKISNKYIIDERKKEIECKEKKYFW